MSATRYVIKNLRTEKEYTVDEQGWEDIKKKGWEARYTIVRELVNRPVKGVSFLPDEIQKGAERASAKPEQPAQSRRGEGNNNTADA